MKPCAQYFGHLWAKNVAFYMPTSTVDHHAIIYHEHPEIVNKRLDYSEEQVSDFFEIDRADSDSLDVLQL